MFLDAISFGIAVVFILVGIAGIIIPILPGMLLVWLTVLAYAWATEFAVIGPWLFGLVTVIAFVTGTSGFWLSLLGAQKTGAAKRAIFLGFVGAIIGTFVIPLLGTIIGYALGIILGELIKHRNLQVAIKASLGGIAGWGIATIVEFSGAVAILIIFVVAALTG